MTITVKLNLELVQEGQYYLKGTRLYFDLPYQIYVVNGDRSIPYYRLHINGKFAAMFNYERQAEQWLLDLSAEQAHVFDIAEEKPKTFKSYAVTFINLDSRKVSVDTFTTKSESGAVSDFKDCYRHGNYKVLSVTEIPEEEGKAEC